MADIETGDRRTRPHGIALRQHHTRLVCRIQKAEERVLLRMIGLGRIAGRRANTGVCLSNKVLTAEALIRRIAPELLAHPFMHALGKGFRETIGQRLHQNG